MNNSARFNVSSQHKGNSGLNGLLEEISVEEEQTINGGSYSYWARTFSYISGATRSSTKSTGSGWSSISRRQ